MIINVYLNVYEEKYFSIGFSMCDGELATCRLLIVMKNKLRIIFFLLGYTYNYTKQFQAFQNIFVVGTLCGMCGCGWTWTY